jgi:hypothetical protein
MSVETDLFAALGPLVGNRVYPISFPQTGAVPVWPAIRYTIVSTVPAIAMCGDSGDDGADFRIQLDVVDASYSAMRALRLDVLAEMATFVPPAIFENSTDQDDAETKTYRSQIDYVIYKSTALTP